MLRGAAWTLRITAFALTLVAGAFASAAEYEIEIEVDDEQDLYDLYAQRQISDATLEALVELINEGVDLNRASRRDLYVLPNLTLAQVDAILLYRKQVGSIGDPAELVQMQVITGEELRQLTAFLVVEPRAVRIFSGTAKVRSAYSAEDGNPPPAALQATLKLPYDVSAAAALLTTRLQLGTVSYDPNREALAAVPPSYAPQLPKWHLRWKTPGRSAVLGHFEAGFGQRLTLDNTTRTEPNGFYPDNVVFMRNFEDLIRLCRMSVGDPGSIACTVERIRYGTPDFDWNERFRGMAFTVEDLETGAGRLALHGFGSYQSRSVYQYQLFNRRLCADPHDDGDGDCDAPKVFSKLSDPFAPAPRFSFSTLPGLFDELAGGGNATLAAGPTLRVGMTGYYAAPLWRVEGASIDFQEWARWPYGGPFGALGADAQTRVGPLDLAMEVTRSFDSLPGGGGGLGVIERTTMSSKRRELELSLRYYDRKFANPYAGSISGPDLYDGLRARNEAGARLSYRDRLTEDWRVRGSADLWVLPFDGELAGTAGRTNLYTSARVDFVGLKSLKASAWADYRDKDLKKSARGECYEYEVVEYQFDSLGGGPDPEALDQFTCSGELARLAGKVVVDPFDQKLTLAVHYAHTLLDDAKYQDRYRQDSAGWVEVGSKAQSWLRLRARARYLDEANDKDDYLERSVWAFLDVSVISPKALTVRGRYDLYVWLDQRDSSKERKPNPEQRFRLEVSAKF
ncbi:MAG: helix-hairpin-helix domain-containing protein [Myxococcales bacterium]|nr:helix-hairpin-helix domain-containing protein [Myxococcales bacterium]